MPFVAIFLLNASDSQGLRVVLLIMLLVAVVLLISGSVIALVTLRSHRRAARSYAVPGESESRS
jgi:flagellar basal body-associated protein FliL